MYPVGTNSVHVLAIVIFDHWLIGLAWRLECADRDNFERFLWRLNYEPAPYGSA